jgi:hypothetical protein|tara:strand:- start:461 stop:685 length:225 start_codon:yes stop_codon:yes gene_type:complete
VEKNEFSPGVFIPSEPALTGAPGFIPIVKNPNNICCIFLKFSYLLFKFALDPIEIHQKIAYNYFKLAADPIEVH